MAALDTNVLVRFLVKDDPKQADIAEQFILGFSGIESSLFIPISVILETEWVLRSVYSFPKADVLSAFVGLLEARELYIQDEATFERAVYLYREHNVDFADCLHVATAFTHDYLPLKSFDRRATKVEGIEQI